MKYVSAKFDKSIESFFQFYRFLNSFAILVFVIFAFMNIWHWIVMEYSWENFCFYLPCVVFYSHFHQNEDFVFTITYLSFGLIGLFITLYKWVKFDIIKKQGELYENQNIKFSKDFFNSWDFTIDSRGDRADLRSILRNEMTTAVEEDKIKEVIKKRTKEDNLIIYGKRAALILLNLFILIVGWGCIILANYFSTDIV